MAHSRTASQHKPAGANHAADGPEQTNAPVPLNFRVPSEFRKEFKVYAAQKGVHMNELVQHAFEALKERDRG
jgi:predicted HicB family RNase H-like nuclease